jgi:hypothetical protein
MVGWLNGWIVIGLWQGGSYKLHPDRKNHPGNQTMTQSYLSNSNLNIRLIVNGISAS